MSRDRPSRGLIGGLGSAGLTGGEHSADEAAPLGPGDGLQANCVLGGGVQLGHVVRGGCWAQDHLLAE